MSRNIGLMAAVAAAAGIPKNEAGEVEVTADLIAQHFPAVAAELRASGADAEHARMSGIDAAMAPGFADIIATHKADRSKQPGDAALAIIAAQTSKREQMKGVLDKDEAALAGLRSATPPKAETSGDDKNKGITMGNTYSVAARAREYIAEQRKLGRTVSPAEAVSHITSQGA